ncbi:MAG: hypothetical protein QXL51_03045 [Candidatus Aenigmatarchaeota archaeon]
MDFSTIKRVAVLPFENFTNERNAGDIVREVVINEFLVSDLVDVVLPGDVANVLEKLRIKPGQPLNSEQIKALAQILKVEAVITGTVNKYTEVPYGNISIPEISITLRMVEADSGSIIWSVTKNYKGTSFWSKHFGTGKETMSDSAMKAVKEAIKTLYKH